LGLHFRKKTAGRNFKAMCGHKIEKGETYVATDDYIMWNHVHNSSCVACHNEKSRIKLVDGEFVVTGKPTPLVMMKGASA